MRVLLLTAHSIAEYDDVRMFTDMGYDVFSIGAYSNPSKPGDDKRPALPNAPYHPELEALCPDQMAAKAHLPDELIEWADAIVVHHFPETWLYGQWDRIRHKRPIWRTCGQSNPVLEDMMRPLRDDGLRIVRYSPAEQRFFESIGHFAGVDAMIRFGKYPSDYGKWNGHDGIVANVTQHMAQRGQFCGLNWYLDATKGLKASPAGPGSLDLPGGVGALTSKGLVQYLRRARCYVYTGTVPASYTLGLIEALLTGVPVVTMSGDAWMGPTALWEADDLTRLTYADPSKARHALQSLLDDRGKAEVIGTKQRERAVQMFDVTMVGAQWRALLGEP